MDAIQVTPKVKTVHAKPKVKPLPIKPKVKPAQASSYAKPDQATSKSTSVQAKTWDLKETEKEAATESFDQGEKVLDGPDERVLVNPNDLTPAIVKLQVRYQGQLADDKRWGMGTGWLIRPDLLVTAGHMVFDWENKFGRCIEVKAYVGYNGCASVLEGKAQFQRGKKVVTTIDFLEDEDNRQADVAFIQLDKPFKDVNPITFAPTPETGNEILGVVGYPGDKVKDMEPGAQMWAEFKKTSWNLSDDKLHMLKYRINTAKGDSGSPVLRKDRNQAIGTHVIGTPKINGASTIGGKHRNPYNAYISAFDGGYEIVSRKGGVSTIQIPTNSGSEGGMAGPTPELDFGKILKTALKVTGPVGSALSAVAPALGPIGGPVAGVAGTVLGVASSLAGKSESSLEQASGNRKSNHEKKAMNDAGANPDRSSSSVPEEYHVYRAVLAEAVLQSVQSLPTDVADEIGLYDTMESSFDSIASPTKIIAPKILPPIFNFGLKFALDALKKQESGMESDLPPSSWPRMEKPPTKPRRENDFLKGLTGGSEGESGDEFFTKFEIAIKKGDGRTWVQPEGGLMALSKLMPESESAFAPSQQDIDTQVLANRAVIAEGALRAVEKADTELLEREGFFPIVKSILTKYGPPVVKAAPQIYDAVKPLVKDLLDLRKQQESGGLGGDSGRKKKQTFGQYVNAMGAGDGDGDGDQQPSSGGDKSTPQKKRQTFGQYVDAITDDEQSTDSDEDTAVDGKTHESDDSGVADIA